MNFRGKTTNLSGRVVGLAKLDGQLIVALDTSEFVAFSYEGVPAYRGRTPSYITHVTAMETSSLAGLLFCLECRILAIYNKDKLVVKLELKD
jgi:hypothetical protein